MREMRRAQSSGVALVMYADLTLTENLDAVRVDVVQVTHQIGTGPGCLDGNLIEPTFGGPQTGNPLPTQYAP